VANLFAASPHFHLKPASKTPEFLLLILS
jgi:hypothetical protein